MPKRSCPFPESNRPHFKNHIGLKEVNGGVMAKENMKKVYDRTLAMMYQAQENKENHTQLRLNSLNSCPQGGVLKVLPGQRKLNFSGQLDGYYTSDEVSQRMDESLFMPIHCSICTNIPSASKLCQFCERCLCELCCVICPKCQSTFCCDCVTTRYGRAAGEEKICFGCL